MTILQVKLGEFGIDTAIASIYTITETIVNF